MKACSFLTMLFLMLFVCAMHAAAQPHIPPPPPDPPPPVGLAYECASSTGTWGLWPTLANEGPVAAVTKPIFSGKSIVDHVRQFKPDFVLLHRPNGQPPQCREMSYAADLLAAAHPLLSHTAANDAAWTSALTLVAYANGNASPPVPVYVYVGALFANDVPFSTASNDEDMAIVNESGVPLYNYIAAGLPITVVIDAAADNFPEAHEYFTDQFGRKRQRLIRAASPNYYLLRAAEQYLAQRGAQPWYEAWPHKHHAQVANPTAGWVIRGHDIANMDPAMNPGAAGWAAPRNAIAGPIMAMSPSPSTTATHLKRREWVAYPAHEIGNPFKTAADIKRAAGFIVQP